MAKLKNEKQECFVQEYLVDLNATQAYIRAGYTVKNAHKNAARLMANQGVRARVEELLAARSRRTGVNQDRVVRELARVAFVDPTQLIGFETGALKTDASEDDRTAIAGVRVKIIPTPDGVAQTSVTTSSRTYSVATLLAGNYIMEVEASGNGGLGYASSSPCVVTSGGGTGGGIYPRAAQTIGSNVRIRSTPTTDSSTNILYTIPAAGTNITVTDPYVNGSDGFAWWPVTYQSYRGYIRSDFVLILVS